MKLIVVFWFCGVLAVSGAKAKNNCLKSSFLRGTMLKCAVVHGATETDIDDYVFLRRAPSAAAKCFRACIFTECQWFNGDGSFVDIAPQSIAYITSRKDSSNWAVAQEVSAYCVDTTPVLKSRCDTTEAFIRCLTANSPIKLSLEGAL